MPEKRSNDQRPAKAPRARLRLVDGAGARAVQRRLAGKGPVAVRGTEVMLDGRTVAYKTGGWGPLLVLIHGVASSSDTWEPVLPGLARKYTVLAPDLLGHGRSDKARGDYSIAAHANTVRDLMDALGYRRATLVGHSLGGAVAMQMAYQYPVSVDRLALVAPAGLGREISMLLRAASVPGSGPLLSVAASRPLVETGAVLAHLAARLGLHANTDIGEAARGFAALAQTGARDAFLHTLRSIVDHAGQRVSAQPRLDVPARHPSLIVWGDRDRIVPVRHGEQLQELVPNTYLARFPKAGHFPHRDDPKRFVQVVDEFLAREWGVGRSSAALHA
jgi:pimeloyl-ACP methyl ester carboxylesterase